MEYAFKHGELCEIIDHPAVGEEFITQPNPDYVEATEGFFETVDNPNYVAPTYEPGYFETVPAQYTPAVGDKTIEVTNPDYVPATPETSTVVHHEAVTMTYWKYVKNGGYGEKWLDYNAGGKVKIDGHWYQSTGKSKQVTVTEAWDETIVTPGTPEQGTPTIIIDNPDYVPAVYTPAHEVWVEPVYTPAVGEPTLEQWVDGTEASGEPTLEVENAEYVPAWTEQVCKPGDGPGPHPGNDIVLPPTPCEATAIFTDQCWLQLPPAGLDEVCEADETWWECYLLQPLEQPTALNTAPVATVATPVIHNPTPASELAVTGADPLGATAGLSALLLVGAGLAVVGLSKRRRARSN